MLYNILEFFVHVQSHLLGKIIGVIGVYLILIYLLYTNYSCNTLSARNLLPSALPDFCTLFALFSSSASHLHLSLQSQHTLRLQIRMSYFHSCLFSISWQWLQSSGMTIDSRSPLRLATLSPLLVLVRIVISPEASWSMPSKTTSLSNLHHHAGRPVFSVHARIEELVKALVATPGPGIQHPSSGVCGGVKIRTLFSLPGVFLGVKLRRSSRRAVGERSAALDCVLELRIRA